MATVSACHWKDELLSRVTCYLFCVTSAGKANPPKNLHRLWTDEVLDEIVSAISDGNYRAVAARSQGVRDTVWDEWMRWGGAGVEPYATLLDRVVKAEAEACVWHVRNMKSHAKGENHVILHDKDGKEIGVRTVGDWRPSSFFLSRKFAQDWSEKATLQQAAETAIAEEQIELSIPLLEQYLAKAGYRLLPLDTEPGRSDTEVSNDSRQTSSAKKGRGGKPRP